jgi:hypothetical protein
MSIGYIRLYGLVPTNDLYIADCSEDVVLQREYIQHYSFLTAP